jgi:two-component system response regulator DegU
MDPDSPTVKKTNPETPSCNREAGSFLLEDNDLESRPSKPPALDPAHAGHPKILRLVVIDNHNLFREGMLRLLIMEGDFAPVTGSYAEARELVRHFWPDLLLFGLGPLEQGGMQTAKSLRHEFPTIPLMLLDETVRFRHVREALASNAQGYWTKHASFSQITAAMRCVTSGGQSFCPDVEKRLRKTPSGLRFDPPHDHPDLALLTHRESELFLLLAEGYPIAQCAELMGIGENTAGSHRARILRKLKIRDNAQIMRLAIEEGLLE